MAGFPGSCFLSPVSCAAGFGGSAAVFVQTGRLTRFDSWTADERKITKYARTLTNLLALRPDGFDPARLRVEDVIAEGAMGDHNRVHELQNYVVGPSPAGLALAPDGASLDFERSFVRVDYFRLLSDLSVRNNVQPGVEHRPVDFVAVRLPAGAAYAALGEGPAPSEVFWLHGGRERQALILARTDDAGRLLLRYLPVKNSTTAVGSLVLGAYEGDRLIYVGRVGTGFTDRMARTWWRTGARPK